MKALFSLTALLLLATPVMAQTAEETVAFIILGAEDQKLYDLDAENKPVVLKSTSPAVYDMPMNGKVDTLKITKINDCKYDVYFSGYTNEPEYILDFSNSKPPSFVESPGWTYIDHTIQKCNTDASVCTSGGRLNIRLETVDRLQKAFDYFANKFCKPRAF